jgi:Protein of unknown function (DUF4232)
MRPSRIIAVVALAAAVAATGSYLAVATATHPSPSSASQPPATASPVSSAAAGTRQPAAVGPDQSPSTSGTSPSGGQPAPGPCAAPALRGSVQDQDGAAGTIYTTIRLRNVSAETCTVKGIPQVRLLGDQGQPATAPSVPSGPVGSAVVLRPGKAARFTFSRPNACDALVAGSRLRVTLPGGQGSLTVPLGAVTAFGTCSSVRVRTLEASTAPTVPTTPPVDRISDPQVAADRLVAAWLGGDRTAARQLTSQAVTDRLFSESPPAQRPVALPCRLADLGVFVCSYPLAEHAELSVSVVGGASAGYRVHGVEFGD